MNRNNDRTQQIRELVNSIMAADCQFKIWWIFWNSEDRAEYAEAMDETVLYFRAAISAHFLAAIVALYGLYETHRDTFNIPDAIKQAPQIVQTAVQSKRHAANLLWIKISIIRNECLAHVSSNFSTFDVFKKAGLCPNDLKQLIDLSRDIVNEIAYAHDRSSPAIAIDPSDEVRSILDQLKKNMEMTRAH